MPDSEWLFSMAGVLARRISLSLVFGMFWQVLKHRNLLKHVRYPAVLSERGHDVLNIQRPGYGGNPLHSSAALIAGLISRVYRPNGRAGSFSVDIRSVAPLCSPSWPNQIIRAFRY